MQTGPSVIVHKSGFLAAVAKGIFGMLTMALICATAVGIYGIRIVDKNVNVVQGMVTKTVPDLIKTIPDILESAPELMDALPPILADGLNDRREPGYRSQLAVKTQLASREHGEDEPAGVLEVCNNGDDTVSLLAVRVTFEDSRGVPGHEETVYVATPLATNCHEGRGPLLPGSTRRIAISAEWMRGNESAMTAEVVDIRIWNGPQAPEASEAPEAPGVVPPAAPGAAPTEAASAADEQ